MNYSELYIRDTRGLSLPDTSGDYWENRAAAYRGEEGKPKCTIAVTAYGRLEKTRYCIECILKNTRNVDYELMLIDNGSDDGTLEFFKSVEYGRKKVIHITKNIGTCYAWLAARDYFSGRYLVIVPNDVYVTRNWLSNLLICYESDPRIGFVAPVASSVSNLQQVNLQYGNLDEMQARAAEYNVSDPDKWEERLRCISLVGIYSRPVLDIVGICDPAYLHDFIEDDFAMRLRRSGYKIMLCRDTWICHDHRYDNLSPEELEAFHTRAGYGRSVFNAKYHGLDAWNDILNFEFALLGAFDTYPFGNDPLSILVIDPLCGTPVLEIRNRLKRRGLINAYTFAYTTAPKYFADLETVADSVESDRIEFIETYYGRGMFDVVVLCKPVNAYPFGNDVLKSLERLLKRRGLLLCKQIEGAVEQVMQKIKEEA